MRTGWATVVVVTLASLQVAMTLSVVFVVFVDLGDHFPDASNAQLSWAINAFTIVSAATIVLAAALADRYGRRRASLVGTGLFVVGSLIAATAPAVIVLIAGRAVQALGAALHGPAGLALILEAIPYRSRGVAIGVFTMGTAFAAAAGPSLGGVIVAQLGWRWAFVAAVPVGLISIVLGALVYEESFGTTDRRLPDPIGSLLVMSGVGAVILALVQTDDWGWTDARTLTALGVGLALVALLLYRSARHPRPIVDLALYRRPSFRAGNAGIACFAMSFFTMQFAAILFLTEVWGEDLDRAGLLASPFFFATAAMGPVAGRAVDGLGARVVVTTGAVVWTAAIVALALVIGEEPTVGPWLAVVIAGGLGAGMVWGGAPTLAVDGLDTAHFATASGMNQTLSNTGNALAIAVAIALLGDDPGLDDFRVVFALIIGAGMLTAAIASTAGPRARFAPGADGPSSAPA